MSDHKHQPQNQQAFTQLSAQFIHDIATPLASIQILAGLLETHLPATLAAYQRLKSQGAEIDEIPPEQLLALQTSAANIKVLAQQINTATKEYWQQIDQQSFHQDSELPSIGQACAVTLENSLRILVVEDDDIHQKIAFKLLSGRHSVDIAKNGFEAVECCRNQLYDLVLMDLHMPEKDGAQAVIEIMQLPLPPQLIIGLTNRPLGMERKQLLQQGFATFIEKPLRLDELQNVLSRRGTSANSAGSMEIL